MKLKLKQAVLACQALEELKSQPLPYREARALKELRDKLQGEYEFFAEEERKLVDRLQGQVSGGTIRFPREEDREAYRERMEELSRLEVEPDIRPLRLSVEPNLSVSALEALEEILTFG